MKPSSISTSSSVCKSTDDLDRICRELAEKLNNPPDLVITSYSSLCDTAQLTTQLANHFPNSAIMGASTCRGSITADGVVKFGEPNVSLWGLSDDDGDYGVGFARYDASVEVAAHKALDMAIKQAGREGELPDLIWIHSSPGHEEKIVATLDHLLGHDVSIVGGSAADENLEAKWSCLAGTEHTKNGVVLAVFFSSFEISTSFQCGYLPTGKSGEATRCAGRTVYEIDNQPAAKVYNAWTNNLVDLDSAEFPANILGSSTLSPVGIAVGELSGIAYYNLAHPETFTEDLALTFFCEIEQGQTLTLMSGELDNIVSRPGRVASEAIQSVTTAGEDVIGGLVVFCGGCLLAVETRVEEIRTHLNSNMNNVPFMGCFTFGEQGRFSGGENRHGNLMISVTVFRA